MYSKCINMLRHINAKVTTDFANTLNFSSDFFFFFLEVEEGRERERNNNVREKL